jgi:hypothetical protein
MHVFQIANMYDGEYMRWLVVRVRINAAADTTILRVAVIIAPGRIFPTKDRVEKVFRLLHFRCITGRKFDEINVARSITLGHVLVQLLPFEYGPGQYGPNGAGPKSYLGPAPSEVQSELLIRLLVRRHIIHAEGTGQRSVGRNTELNPHSLTGERRQAEWTTQCVSIRWRNLVEVAECCQRTQQCTRRVANFDEQLIELRDRRRFLRIDVQPEVKIRCSTRWNSDGLEFCASSTIGRSENGVTRARMLIAAGTEERLSRKRPGRYTALEATIDDQFSSTSVIHDQRHRNRHRRIGCARCCDSQRAVESTRCQTRNIGRHRRRRRSCATCWAD